MLRNLWNRVFGCRPVDVPHVAFAAAEPDEPEVRQRAGRAPIVAVIHGDGSVDVDSRVADRIRAAHPSLKRGARARTMAPAVPKKLAGSKKKSAKKKGKK